MTNGYNTPIGVPIGLPSILSLGLPPLVNPYPTLNLDFINNPQFDSRITFSRGSQATLFDSTGTLVYAKHNLLLQSQDFATTWANFQTTEATNVVIAPDGSLTADKLIEDANAGTHLIQQSFTTTAVAHTFSVYIKAAERTWAFLANSTIANASAYFDLTSGTLGTVGAAATASIVAVGNGWYRCSITMTTTAASNAFRVQLANGNNGISYTGDGTSGVYIWGAQLNIANMEGGVTSSLTTYYPTTTAAYYAPRFDYNPSTLQPRGLLIEEQRTNSIRNNTMQGAVAGTPGTLPTNWSGSTGLTGLTQQIVGTGTESGITYIDIKLSGTPSAAGVYRYYFETSTGGSALTGQTWTNSYYIKLAAGSLTGVSSFTDIYQEFTSGGVYVTEGGVTAATPTSAALATQRSATTRTLTGGATVAFLRSGIQLSLSGVAIDITLRIGLPQLEQGAFATSVIPTTTTALTRNADVASMTGTNFSSWYNAAQGMLYVQYVQPNSLSGNKFIATLSDGTSSNRMMYLTETSPNRARWYVDAAGANQANVAAGDMTLNAVMSQASVYNTNDFAMSVNGGAVAVDSTGTVPSGINLFQIGNHNSVIWTGYLRRIAYYPTRLTNAQLQALTA